jgi:hypothetical protein
LQNVHPTGHSAQWFSNTVTFATYFRRNHCNPVSNRRFRLFATVAVRFEAAVLNGSFAFAERADIKTPPFLFVAGF